MISSMSGFIGGVLLAGVVGRGWLAWFVERLRAFGRLESIRFEEPMVLASS
jgi:hypothetical protein